MLYLVDSTLFSRLNSPLETTTELPREWPSEMNVYRKRPICSGEHFSETPQSPKIPKSHANNPHLATCASKRQETHHGFPPMEKRLRSAGNTMWLTI